MGFIFKKRLSLAQTHVKMGIGPINLITLVKCVIIHARLVKQKEIRVVIHVLIISQITEIIKRIIKVNAPAFQVTMMTE